MMPDGVTIAFALAAAIVAWAGRKRLPTGLGEGTFVAAMSGSSILLFATDKAGSYSIDKLGHTLSGLTVAWYVFARLAARPKRGNNGAAAAVKAADTWAYAALLHGFAAVALLMTVFPGSFISHAPATLDFLLLAIPAVLVLLFRTGGWAPYPAAALLLCLLTSLAPSRLIEVCGARWSWGLTAVGLLCLASVITVVIEDWRHRRRQWLERPEGVAIPLTPPKWLLAGVVGISMCVGVGGLLCLERGMTPIALWLSALACFVAGHVITCTISGEIGLVLTAEGIVAASMAWLTPSWPGALIGLALAGGFLVWLARFWGQQLDDERAWTTAGRLIPITRRLGYTASLGAVAAAIGAWVMWPLAPAYPTWSIGLIALLLLGVMSLLARDGLELDRGGLGAACFMAAAAGAVLSEFAADLLDSPVNPIAGITGAALLLVVRLSIGLRSAATNFGADVSHFSAPAAFIGGVTPIVVLLILSKQGFSAHGLTAAAITVAALIVGWRCVGGFRAAINSDKKI